jgi:hypothetical protein
MKEIAGQYARQVHEQQARPLRSLTDFRPSTPFKPLNNVAPIERWNTIEVVAPALIGLDED